MRTREGVTKNQHLLNRAARCQARSKQAKERREDVKRAFNADPAKEPLRILLCTDAAREGINLQTRCRDLVHFDLPWNPSRLEQRNGRIDRKMGGAASWALVIDPLARASRVRPH